MKQALIISIVILKMTIANADVVKCIFTEPFFSLIINTDTKVVSLEEPDYDSDNGELKTTVIAKNIRISKLKLSNVSALIDYPQYTIKDNKNKEILTLSLNYQGTDGMSDLLYPYSTTYKSYYGGCYSDKLARIGKSEELEQKNSL